MTMKTDDMTDRGRYNLSPFGAFDRYSDDCCWRVTFRGVQANFDLGVYDSKAEAEKVIADSIAGARAFAKEEAVRLEREAQERAAAATQQIPKAYRGLTLDDLSQAARDFVATFKDRPPSAEPIVFGDVDTGHLKVACTILIELARQGYSTLYVTINDILNTRPSDLTAP